MRLETERLILRRYKEDDLQDLYEYLSNPKVLFSKLDDAFNVTLNATVLC